VKFSSKIMLQSTFIIILLTLGAYGLFNYQDLTTPVETNFGNQIQNPSPGNTFDSSKIFNFEDQANDDLLDINSLKNYNTTPASNFET
jgi:hypothetical protein